MGYKTIREDSKLSFFIQDNITKLRLHFAVSPSGQHINTLKECNVENVLTSFAFNTNSSRLVELFENYQPKNLIIDSGAFSVWANNQTIDIYKYLFFCRNLKREFPSSTQLYFVNLDVLPGKFGTMPTEEEAKESARQGFENMLLLEKEGLKVIPVFHQHEDFEWLEKLKNHTDYIGVSPANDQSMYSKKNFLNKVFKDLIKTKTKAHGFAVTSHTQLYEFPFFSVDSSSWVSPARFGRIPVFKDNLTMGTFEYKDKEQVLKNWDYIKHIGIEKLGADSWKDRVKVSIKSFQNLEKIASKLWEKRGIVWE